MRTGHYRTTASVGLARFFRSAGVRRTGVGCARVGLGRARIGRAGVGLLRGARIGRTGVGSAGVGLLCSTRIGGAGVRLLRGAGIYALVGARIGPPCRAGIVRGWLTRVAGRGRCGGSHRKAAGDREEGEQVGGRLRHALFSGTETVAGSRARLIRSRSDTRKVPSQPGQRKCRCAILSMRRAAAETAAAAIAARVRRGLTL